MIARKQKRYVSVDVEASGRTPGKYSMLSLGACIVGDVGVQFYRELKPISDNFDYGAMKIGCLGLDCLKGKGPRYNARKLEFSPRMVLGLMKQECEDPFVVMNDFRDWVIGATKGYEPIIAAAPIKFDGMFITWYFDNFCSHQDPFGHRGEDINSMYRGKRKDVYAHVSDMFLRPSLMPHNSLEDAIIQAREFEAVLDGIKQ
jgi:ribonuclease T